MRCITLSFDNGPDRQVTPAVLDVLARHGIASTFFVIGRKIADPEGRALAAEARARGHWIGNHTYTHTVPLGSSEDPDAPEAEIGRTQKVLGELAHPDRLFRPYGGGGHLDGRVLSRAARDYLCAHGYSCVLWNSVPRDWDDPGGWPARALADVARRDWSLVVLHDIAGGCLDNLEDFIRQVRDSGGEFVQSFPPSCLPIHRGELVRPEGLPDPAI